MLKIQEFIRKNPDNFRTLLAEKPYALKIQEDEHFMLLKYNQIDSDFSNEIVRECRGIILDKSDWSVACHPFHKFGNYGESYVPDIDWASASVQEKLDGCVSEDEKILTDSGEISIKVICENPQDYKVFTYNFEKDAQELNVIEEISIKDNNDDWYEIELENETKVKLTGSHRVWIENLKCYRQVKDLIGDEEVLLFQKN